MHVIRTYLMTLLMRWLMRGWRRVHARNGVMQQCIRENSRTAINMCIAASVHMCHVCHTIFTG